MSSKYGSVMKKQFRLNLWFSVFVLLTMISCGSDERDVHCKRQVPPTVLGSSTNGASIEYLTNSEVYLDATLYVPQATLSAYKAKDGWKEFGNIIEEE